MRHYCYEVAATLLLLMVYMGMHLLGRIIIEKHFHIGLMILMLGLGLLIYFWNEQYSGVKLRRVTINATVAYVSFGYFLIVINT